MICNETETNCRYAHGGGHGGISGRLRSNADTNTESSQNPQESTEAQAVHLNLAESWGFEYFYTIITPEVSSSSYDITYYLTSFYDTL